jgi:hypothetical protein
MILDIRTSVKNPSPLMDMESSLLPSQESVTNIHPEPD